MRFLDVLNPFYVFRDAVTGRFVSRFYALMNPSTTFKQRVYRWRDTPEDPDSSAGA